MSKQDLQYGLPRSLGPSSVTGRCTSRPTGRTLKAHEMDQFCTSATLTSGQQFPTFLASETSFTEDNFSMDGRGWFADDSSVLRLLCTLSLLLLHQLPLGSTGIRSQRLGTPALGNFFLSSSITNIPSIYPANIRKISMTSDPLGEHFRTESSANIFFHPLSHHPAPPTHTHWVFIRYTVKGTYPGILPES